MKRNHKVSTRELSHDISRIQFLIELMKFYLLKILLFFCFIAFVNDSNLFAEDEKPNVLLICVDDLRPELNCFGKNYISSPNIDKLAAEGMIFSRHYVQAPTCGASRFTLLTGRYGGRNNGALFQRADQLKKNPDKVPSSMPAWFREKGYYTISIGKVSHHPGGRGGKDWNDDAKPEMPNSWDEHIHPSGDWQHPRGAMHGLANGEIRRNAKEMSVYQATEGGDEIYPDGLTTNMALKKLDEQSRESKPFFMAVGIIRPHLPFGAPAKYYKHYETIELPKIPHPQKPDGKTTWHGSGEFMKYNRWKRNPNEDKEFATLVRKHYAACVSYADAQVGRIMEKLESLDKAKNTIVVLWGDHGWHLGEHSIWGKHSLFEESLHSPLVIRVPQATQKAKVCSSIVETIDIFPTLCDLCEVDTPIFAQGKSLSPQLADHTKASNKPAISYKTNAQTIRTPTHRLISHKKGHIELYDHRTDRAETKNIAASNPDLVKKLSDILKTRLGLND